MKKEIVILFCIGLILLSGCIRDDCPSDYIVQETDRIRCYQEHTQYSSLSAANILTGEIACGINTDVNCMPNKRLEEVDCPNACIQAIAQEVKK